MTAVGNIILGIIFTGKGSFDLPPLTRRYPFKKKKRKDFIGVID